MSHDLMGYALWKKKKKNYYMTVGCCVSSKYGYFDDNCVCKCINTLSYMRNRKTVFAMENKVCFLHPSSSTLVGLCR
jgi:hypothetical protein